MTTEKIVNQESRIPLYKPVPEPWDEPVDAEQLLNDLVTAYNKYVILPDHAAPALALWTLYTYGFENFEFSPRIVIASPEKRCGKSSLLTMLHVLASKTLFVSNISPASIYRTVEVDAPTLLIDEADTFLRKYDDMTGILNAGHRAGGKVVRTEYRGKSAIPMSFGCFAPCAIAAIKKHTIDGPLLDRSLIIQMRRKTAYEKVERLRIRDVEKEYFDLTRKCLRFMNDHGEELGQMRPDAPLVLSDRGADNWECLFAIADFVSPQWGKIARESAIGLSKANNQDDDDGSIGMQLLYDLREIFDVSGNDFIQSTILCEKLADREERGWSDFGYRHERIRPHQLARLLRDFGIKPRDKRMGHQVAKCYFRDDFTEAFERYIPEKDRDTATDTNNVSVYYELPKIEL